MKTGNHHKFTLCIMIFLLCEIIISDDLLQSKNRDSIRCNNNLISHFILKPEIKYSKEVDEDILKICPTLTNTCCTETEMLKQFNIIKMKGDSLERMVSDTTKLIDMILGIGPLGTQKLMALAIDNKCVGKEESNLEKSYERIFLQSSLIKRDVEVSMKYFRKRSASLLCSLCTPETGNEIIINATNKKILIVSSEYCKSFFTEKEAFSAIRFFHNLTFLQSFVSVSSCLYRNKVEISPFFGNTQWSMVLKQIDICSSQFTNRTILESSNCINFCKQMNPLNINIFKSVSPEIAVSIIYLKEILKSSSYLNCNPKEEAKNGEEPSDKVQKCIFNEDLTLDMAEEMKEIQTFSYYMDSSLVQDSFDLTKMSWTLSNVEGMNPEIYSLAYFEGERLLLQGLLLLFICLLSFIR